MSLKDVVSHVLLDCHVNFALQISHRCVCIVNLNLKLVLTASNLLKQFKIDSEENGVEDCVDDVNYDEDGYL